MRLAAPSSCSPSRISTCPFAEPARPYRSTCMCARRYTLCTGLFAYCAYIGSFLVATVVEGATARWAAVLIGSAISGLGAGFLWTAQGQYFQVSAKLYAAQAGIEPKDASGLFAGIFTSIYLSFEVLMKLLSSTLELEKRQQFVYTLYVKSHIIVIKMVQHLDSNVYCSQAPLVRGVPTKTRLEFRVKKFKPHFIYDLHALQGTFRSLWARRCSCCSYETSAQR